MFKYAKVKGHCPVSLGPADNSSKSGRISGMDIFHVEIVRLGIRHMTPCSSCPAFAERSRDGTTVNQTELSSAGNQHRDDGVIHRNLNTMSAFENIVSCNIIVRSRSSSVMRQTHRSHLPGVDLQYY